jgi:hypothetical protein
MMSQLTVLKRIHSNQKTLANIEIVLKAIGTYCALKDMVLPFPSKTDMNIGEQSESMKDTFGLVPHRAIGLMAGMTKSGEGIPLQYKMNPMFRKSTSSTLHRTLGISGFASDIATDKVAIIIKSVNKKGKDEIVIWYSEKNFIANYAGGHRPPVEKQTSLGPGLGSSPSRSAKTKL